MFPSFVAPMLPSLVDRPPDGEGWIHEIKFDGYRTLLVIEQGEVRAFTRSGFDWSDRYNSITQSARALHCTSAVLDGEMCVQAPDGRTDFDALPRAISEAPGRLILFAFDLLYYNGRDMRGLPLLDRRRHLKDLLDPFDEAARIQFSQDYVGDGRELFKVADQVGLEGIVSKRADSRYVSGRSDAWLKAKCFTVGDFEVLGIDRSTTGAPIALLGRPDGRGYAGDAVIALAESERKAFWAAVERLGTPHARLAGLARRRSAKWVKAGLVARVRHVRGDATLLRHATLQRLELWEDPNDP